MLDEKEMYAHIERLGAELEKIEKGKRVTRKYTDYYKVTQEKTAEINFALDHDKIDEKLSRAGFFILISNDMSLSGEDVLAVYRERDVIEKNFDQFKNDLDFRRLRTHINKTTEGKLFVGFLALILRSYLMKKIKGSPDTKNLTLDKALIELRKIKAVTTGDTRRMLTPLTKLQRTVLEALGISSDKLLTSFT
jgi:transposase